MGLEEVNSLGDPEEEFASLEKATGGGKSKNKKSGPPVPLIVILGASPVVVFLTMWLAFSKTNPPLEPVAAADSSAVIQAPTVALTEAVEDTVPQRDPELPPEVEQAVLDSARQQGYYLGDASGQQRFIEQLALMRDRLANEKIRVSDLESQVADKAAMALVLEELKSENATLKNRLDYMEQTLPSEVVRQLLSYQANRLASAEQPLSEAEIQAAKVANARRLAKIYESMKPAEAARIFKRLSDEEVTLILQGMRQRNAAKIMAAMDTGHSARISKRMGSTN